MIQANLPPLSTFDPKPSSPSCAFSIPDCLVHNPRDLLISMLFRNRYPHLGECECPLYSRIDKPQLRKKMENSLIEKITRMHPLIQWGVSDRLSIASIGSGGCFQELVILALLLRQGYRNIEMTLIDSCYEERIPNRLYSSLLSVEEFKKCVDDALIPFYPDACIQIEVQTQLKEAFQDIQAENAPQIFLLIDLQNEKDEIANVPLLSSCLEMIVNHPGISNDAIIAATVPTQDKNKSEQTMEIDNFCLTKTEYVTQVVANKNRFNE